MSHIFDALQRSEGERSGNDSSQLAEATELLLRAERRVAAQWETSARIEQLPEAAENLEAAAPAPEARRRGDGKAPWWDLERRLVWLIALFERLEQREQAGRF